MSKCFASVCFDLWKEITRVADKTHFYEEYVTLTLSEYVVADTN